MPLYEYQCSSCGHRFERIERVSGQPETTCTACGQRARRLLSAPALQFKGSGWYVTDYGKGSGGRAGEAPKTSGGESTSAESSSETKTSTSESKPAESKSTESKSTVADKVA